VSVTAVGPAFPLVGPPPEPLPHGLLTIPGVIARNGEERVFNQVNVIGYPTGTPGIWEACSEGTFRVKDEGEPRPQDRWDPFAAFFALACSSLGIGPYDEFFGQAEAALKATLSHAVEDVLSKGVTSNPYFGDLDFIALASGAAVAPRVGLSYLENAMGVRTGREGIIHATPAVAAAWGFGELEEEADGVMRTPVGTPVAIGSGYIGAHPLGSGGLAGPGDTTDWVFGTGPVQVYIEDALRTRVEESLDRSNNDVVVRAEKYVLAEWDKALQVGVLIDWTQTP
jgi:hypothetical protein